MKGRKFENIKKKRFWQSVKTFFYNFLNFFEIEQFGFWFHKSARPLSLLLLFLFFFLNILTTFFSFFCKSLSYRIAINGLQITFYFYFFFLFTIYK